MCKFDNCLKIPIFNIKNEKALYCFEHKTADMIDVKHPKCFENNCVKRPSFNLPEEKKAVYCFEHKEEIITDKVCV